MSLLRPILALLFVLSFTPLSHTQDEKTFPTDDEINLLVTQTERAVQQYKPLVDLEEIQLGKSGADAVAKDRQVLHALEVVVKALKVNPQGFNTPEGFAFFEWLDDADRNALICQSTALSQALLQMMSGDTAKANELMQLSKSCMDISALLYTVSENAGALYLKYVQAEDATAKEGLKVAQKCADALKKMDAANKRRN